MNVTEAKGERYYASKIMDETNNCTHCYCSGLSNGTSFGVLDIIGTHNTPGL